MTDDGTVDVEAVVALMPPEIAEKAADTIRKCTEGEKSSRPKNFVIFFLSSWCQPLRNRLASPQMLPGGKS
jgi:hypothetical protein